MSSSGTEVFVDVTMPAMGVSVSEGTIVEWSKQPGDWIAYEETICLISTDKIDTDLPAPAAGRVAEILVEVGAIVDVGTVLAKIATDAKPREPHASKNGDPEGPQAEPAAEATDSPAPKPAVAANAERPQATNGRRYSPVVSRIAAEHGIDLAQVEGTGRGGRVRKQDVLAFIEAGPSEEPPLHIESPYKPDPPVTASTAGLSRMRRSIGAHMKRSLETAATCTTWIEVDFSHIEAARRRIGVTALPIVARCAIDTLREFPSVNAWMEGENYKRFDDHVHLGIAVSLGEDGLIVPVVHNAQELAPEGLGKRIKELARAARSKELRPDDVAGATFTITNPGQYGAIMATPVINQPQVAILDLEAVVKRPVVVTDADGSDSIAIRPICILGLSWDHRALDGGLAAQFLAALKRRIEHWD